MTTTEISEEKKKLATAITQLIWDSPLYKDDMIDIDVACIKLAPIHSGPKDKIVGVEITTKII